MNTAEFRKLVIKHFSPNIKKLNWKGSGFHFYKHNPNHVINIFGIQGSWMGGSVCCETAIHLDFLPDVMNDENKIAKKTYASCVIRERLYRVGLGDHWNFRNNEEDNVKSVNEIWEAFKTQGLTFYNDFTNFPYPFDTFKPEHLKGNHDQRLLGKYHASNTLEFAWLLMEINHFIGRPDLAKDFSVLGFDQALENAKRISSISKRKKWQEEVENYVNMNKKMFRL